MEPTYSLTKAERIALYKRAAQLIERGTYNGMCAALRHAAREKYFGGWFNPFEHLPEWSQFRPVRGELTTPETRRLFDQHGAGMVYWFGTFDREPRLTLLALCVTLAKEAKE